MLSIFQWAVEVLSLQIIVHFATLLYGIHRYYHQLALLQLLLQAQDLPEVVLRRHSLCLLLRLCLLSSFHLHVLLVVCLKLFRGCQATCCRQPRLSSSWWAPSWAKCLETCMEPLTPSLWRQTMETWDIGNILVNTKSLPVVSSANHTEGSGIVKENLCSASSQTKHLMATLVGTHIPHIYIEPRSWIMKNLNGPDPSNGSGEKSTKIISSSQSIFTSTKYEALIMKDNGKETLIIIKLFWSSWNPFKPLCCSRWGAFQRWWWERSSTCFPGYPMPSLPLEIEGDGHKKCKQCTGISVLKRIKTNNSVFF